MDEWNNKWMFFSVKSISKLKKKKKNLVVNLLPKLEIRKGKELTCNLLSVGIKFFHFHSLFNTNLWNRKIRYWARCRGCRDEQDTVPVLRVLSV